MLKKIFPILFLLFPFFSSAQISYNMELLDQWNPSVLCNDIWGYVDQQGREYAIIGSRTHVYFFNVTNPSNIQLINSFPGGENIIWRDMKTYQNYAYAVSDGDEEGMMIFDLSNLPNSVSKVSQTNSYFGAAHNIFIDELNGRLYTAGANTSSQGTMVLDLAANPVNPPVLANIDFKDFSGGPNNNGYIHDIFVRDNIAYCSGGWRGYYIWDFSNPSNPINIASLDMTDGYNHSSWVTEDNKYAFYAEEIGFGQPLAVVDLQNINYNFNYNLNNDNLQVDLTFKEPLLGAGEAATPHNPFIAGDRLFVSYYEDGLQVWDISSPLDPVKVAYYDTYSNNEYNGYFGNWGAYPFLPSGTILASDEQNGLFVLRLTEATLPVELIDFSARLNDDKFVDVSWVSANEKDLKTYEVEKSLDGKQFSFLIATQSNGLEESQRYDIVDKNPIIGINYYRLKMINLDGTIEYSPIASVHYKKSSINVFPTLISNKDEVNIFIGENLSTKLEVEVFDLNGRLVAQKTFSSSADTFTFAVGLLENGSYILKVEYNQQIHTEKITVAK